MTVKKLTKEVLDGLVEAIVKSQKVYGPQVCGDKFDFAVLQSAQDLRLDYDVTLQPPKKYLLPACETLMSYEVGGAYKGEFDEETFTLLGVHPYDLIAINQMDMLFSQDHYDSHYMQRRKNATIVACDVANPSADVFASCMNTAIVKEGYDVLLTDIGDGFLAEAATDKGVMLLAQASGAVAKASAMISSEGLIRNQEKTRSLMAFGEDERPLGIQLFGANPETMKKAENT